MITPKENTLRAIYGEKPEYVPMTFEAMKIVGFPIMMATEQPLFQSGYDPFGVYWHVNKSGPMPDVTSVMFEDIADWKKYVKFPDLDAIDFKGIAEKEMEGVDRDAQLLAYYHACGIWERMEAFMGCENALMALLEDPDSCMELFDAITDYRIKIANRVIDAYGLDVYYDYNDVATARSLFMSPETYRKLIKPFQARLASAVNARGAIYAQHCCGKTDVLLDDYVEIGAKIWSSAQIMNDLPALQKKYKGKLAFEGGWDTMGLPGSPNATDDDIRAEVRRTVQEYGQEGNLIILPVLMSHEGNIMVTGHDDRMPALMDEYMKCRAIA